MDAFGTRALSMSKADLVLLVSGVVDSLITNDLIGVDLAARRDPGREGNYLVNGLIRTEHQVTPVGTLGIEPRPVPDTPPVDGTAGNSGMS